MNSMLLQSGIGAQNNDACPPPLTILRHPLADLPGLHPSAAGIAAAGTPAKPCALAHSLGRQRLRAH